MSYVLAIEPHETQAGILRETVGVRARIELTVVDSVDAAMTAIDDEVPKLVLVSALMLPHEESNLVARLRTLPQSVAPEILIIPALSSHDRLAGTKRSLIDRFRKRHPDSQGCDPSAFADQLSTYLDQRKRPRTCAILSAKATGADRRAAARIDRGNWGTVLIDGAAVDVIDLSVTGAQVLSPMVLQPGGTVEMVLAREQDAVRCEAGIVWGGFEIVQATQLPLYRAGVSFKDADRTALERLYFRRG